MGTTLISTKEPFTGEQVDLTFLTSQEQEGGHDTPNTRENVWLMGALITHWGSLIPSEFILGLAKESPQLYSQRA